MAGWLSLYPEKLFIAAVKKFCAFLKMPHPKREDIGEDCTIVDNPSFHRPTPAFIRRTIF